MTQSPATYTDQVNFLLHLADSTLILGHRNSEWCGHGPILEQDIAISNISLDLIGQARNFYQHAASLAGNATTEDHFAYHRDEHEFMNVLLTEFPNTDWAHTILRQFFFSNYQQLLYTRLTESKDEQLSGIAAKALKEITYHLRWSSEWVIRLGDGTDESHSKISVALDTLWPFTAELFEPASYELIDGDPINWAQLKEEWIKRTEAILSEALLDVPVNLKMQTGGKSGKHQHLESLLQEMQHLQRTYPGAEW